MAATKSKAINKKATPNKSTVKALKSGAAKVAAPLKKAVKTVAKKVTEAAAKGPTASAKPAKKAVKKVAKSAPTAPSGKTTVSKSATVKDSVANQAATDARALTVGDVVPAFEALDQAGKLVTSASLAGTPYVIYFYPKDDTPGCTTEACGFRDELAVFEERGVRVIGVSPDSPASHSRFDQKYGLGFTLLADTEKKLVTLFGVWKLKQNYGREYWGVERSTFVVNAQGKVTKQWRGVKVAGHVPAVLQEAASQS